MRIHSLQHVPFEDIGSMANDIHGQGHTLRTTHWYKGDVPPSLDSFDVLVVMGGPMGVYDEDVYPWLACEKTLISETISAGKKIIGICLGAQLISVVLGATVSKNTHREIGWFPLHIGKGSEKHPVAAILQSCDYVFHWHGDTFSLPEEAELIASSEACLHQAYVINNQIYAFQFHLETTEASAAALITHCSEDLDNSTYVQTAQHILSDQENFTRINSVMSQMFNHIINNT